MKPHTTLAGLGVAALALAPLAAPPTAHAAPAAATVTFHATDEANTTLAGADFDARICHATSQGTARLAWDCAELNKKPALNALQDKGISTAAQWDGASNAKISFDVSGPNAGDDTTKPDPAVAAIGEKKGTTTECISIRETKAPQGYTQPKGWYHVCSGPTSGYTLANAVQLFEKNRFMTPDGVKPKPVGGWSTSNTTADGESVATVTLKHQKGSGQTTPSPAPSLTVKPSPSAPSKSATPDATPTAPATPGGSASATRPASTPATSAPAPATTPATIPGTPESSDGDAPVTGPESAAANSPTDEVPVVEATPEADGGASTSGAEKLPATGV